MRKTLLLLLLTAVFCGAFARKTPQVAPAPQVPDSLRGFYLFTEGIKQAFIERDTAAARASLERSVEADSTYGPAWYELAELLLYNDAPAALRHAERAFRTDTTDKWYLLQLGQAQILNDRYRDAIRTYNRLREVDAQNPDSYRVLAMLYDQEGQPFSAIAVLDSAEVRFGRIDALSELKRRLLVGTRQYDRAVAEAQALIEAAPYKAENHLLLGELYARQKKDSLALVQFAEAYRIDSTSVAVLATYSEFYNERRDYASSLNYTRRLFASDEMPLDDKLAYFDRITGDRNFYSTFYLQINDLATTLAMKYPHDPRVVKLYGGHLIASGQLDDALTYYKTHLDDLPPRIDYFNMVIDIESYKQRPDSVERYTSRAMKLFPENVDLHLRKGQMLSYAKRYDEALKFYKNSLRLAPGDSLRGAVWGIIGETYHLMGQQALQKQSEDRQPKASLYESRKGPAARCMRKCYDAYDRSLALRYDNAMVLNNYAYFLARRARPGTGARHGGARDRARREQPDLSGHLRMGALPVGTLRRSEENHAAGPFARPQPKSRPATPLRRHPGRAGREVHGRSLLEKGARRGLRRPRRDRRTVPPPERGGANARRAMTRFALILGLLLCLTVPAAGQKGDLQRQIAEKQRAIDALEKQIARGEQELTSIKKGKNSEQQSVRRLSRQIASRRQLLDETESQLSLLAEQLAASDSTAGALNVRLERYRAQYAAMVREAYRNYKQNSYLTYIFASKDFADVARRIANIRGVAKLREAKLREIAETAQEVGRQQELLAAQQQALDSTRRKIDAQRARYERDQRNAKARLQRMSAREKAVLREKERQEEQLDTAIAELQKLTKGNKAGASFSTRTSNLNLPVEGGRVKRYRDNMAEITGPKGARITAIYEGKVVDVKRNRITNRFDVYIAHGQYITSYANLNSVSVAKGQTVAKNSAIGVIGPAVDIQTMKTEYRLVFGIYPPAGAKKMRASDCFRK